MRLAITVDPLPVRIDAHGVPRVGGTRIPIDRVIAAYKSGATPEEIVDDFPTLQLADVYTIIGYYLRHRPEVDAYLCEREREAEEIRKEIEARFPPEGVRQRLLSRRGGQPQAGA
jgi:uncharacterized protein (DUF433 family)